MYNIYIYTSKLYVYIYILLYIYMWQIKWTIKCEKVPENPLGPSYNSGIPEDDLNKKSVYNDITRPHKNHRSFASCRNSWDASCNQLNLVPGTRFFSSPCLMPDVSPPKKVEMNSCWNKWKSWGWDHVELVYADGIVALFVSWVSQGAMKLSGEAMESSRIDVPNRNGEVYRSRK